MIAHSIDATEPRPRMTLPKAQAEADFTALVERYHGDLLRLAYAMCGDRSMAEDAVQSAWQAAWRGRNELRDAEKVRGWLFTITANEVRRLLRRRRLTALLGAHDNRDAAIEFRPRDVDLARALEHLSSRDRQLIGMHYGLGLTSEEIGSHLGLSASATRVRLHRVLGRLRQELEP